MTIPAWPSTVPYNPTWGSYKIERTADEPLVTDMNSGTTRRRRKYSLRIAPVLMTIPMTDAQAVAFRLWHEATLMDGVSRFTMPVYFGGSYVTRTAVLAAPPSYDHVAPNYVNVSLSLLVENLRTG